MILPAILVGALGLLVWTKRNKGEPIKDKNSPVVIDY